MRPTLTTIAAALAFVLAGSVAGCGTSPNPSLYTIAAIPGTVQTGGPKVVNLHQIGVAAYLDRTSIVRSSDGYRLDVLSNDWWGEPISAMLGRVLVDELGQRLPNSTILLDGGAVSVKADATVEVNIQRLDRDQNGDVLLNAQVSLDLGRRSNPELTTFRISAPTSAAGTGAQVAASSVAIAQLADGVAAMLAQSRPR